MHTLVLVHAIDLYPREKACNYYIYENIILCPFLFIIYLQTNLGGPSEKDIHKSEQMAACLE